MNDSTSATPRRGHLLSTQTILIGLGVFVLIAAALYYVGRTQGRNELAAQKTHYEQQIDQGKQALADGQAELAVSRNRNHLMDARVALYRTAVDLDQRNFGMASGRLHEAAAALGQVSETSDSIDLAKVSALKESIEASDFTVAADLETQRSQVLAFAAELDAIAAGSN